MLYIENRIRKAMGRGIRKDIGSALADSFVSSLVIQLENEGIPAYVLESRLRKELLDKIRNTSSFKEIERQCAEIMEELAGGDAKEIAETVALMLNIDLNDATKSVEPDGSVRYHWKEKRWGSTFVPRFMDLMAGGELISEDPYEGSSYASNTVKFRPAGMDVILEAYLSRKYAVEYTWNKIQTDPPGTISDLSVIVPTFVRKSIRRSVRGVRKYITTDVFTGCDRNLVLDAITDCLCTEYGYPTNLVEELVETNIYPYDLISDINEIITPWIEELAKKEESEKFIKLIQRVTGGDFEQFNMEGDNTTYIFDTEYSDIIEDYVWDHADSLGYDDELNNCGFIVSFKIPGIRHKPYIHMYCHASPEELTDYIEANDIKGLRTFWENHNGEHAPMLFLTVPRYEDLW